MTYATQANMITRFGEPEVITLTDRANLGVVDVVVLADKLAEADAEIEPYLAARHQLPLTAVPKILVGFACDIARYRLCGSGVTETDEIRRRYEDAIKFLVKVSRGEIILGVDAVNVAPAMHNSVQVSAPARVFNSDSLAGYGS